MKDTSNNQSFISKLPKHLQVFVVDQNYKKYTAKNQAVWRYILRKSTSYLGEVAHKSYLKGLEETGISIDSIPKMEGMNRILEKIGWHAVAVDGFIPPNDFMEFQTYHTLVVAADIRTAKHIEYTPAPDIVHEAAGHAPIIANPEYSEYLRRFGEIGSKAISSAKDYELYEAIRHLSIIKENPNTKEQEVLEAEKTIETISNNMGEPSEMARIRNLHWWTVEYGLIGDLKNPKLYGAGLLSSIGESKWCLSDKVEKLPYTIAAADVAFDITKPQPQLFVTPNFSHLSYVLEEFADTMALRNGGLKGVEKLIESKNMGTVELNTGIQISGNFTKVYDDGNYNPIYFQVTGATALAYKNKELIGHGKEYHTDGFGSPVGKLKGINLAIEDMSPMDLEAYGIYEGKHTVLNFKGGVTVTGEVITGKRNLQGKIILISFKNCTVTYKEEILFHPDWGNYDMAVGAEIVSAYAGVADPNNFGLKYEVPKEKTHQIVYTKEQKEIHSLYQEVRDMRENDKVNFKRLKEIFDLVDGKEEEWLLILEIYELMHQINHEFRKTVLKCLTSIKGDKEHLVKEGLELLNPHYS